MVTGVCRAGRGRGACVQGKGVRACAQKLRSAGHHTRHPLHRAAPHAHTHTHTCATVSQVDSSSCRALTVSRGEPRPPPPPPPPPATSRHMLRTAPSSDDPVASRHSTHAHTAHGSPGSMLSRVTRCTGTALGRLEAPTHACMHACKRKPPMHACLHARPPTATTPHLRSGCAAAGALPAPAGSAGCVSSSRHTPPAPAAGWLQRRRCARARVHSRRQVGRSSAGVWCAGWRGQRRATRPTSCYTHPRPTRAHPALHTPTPTCAHHAHSTLETHSSYPASAHTCRYCSSMAAISLASTGRMKSER
jgi:hypothetical protein